MRFDRAYKQIWTYVSNLNSYCLIHVLQIKLFVILPKFLVIPYLCGYIHTIPLPRMPVYLFLCLVNAWSSLKTPLKYKIFSEAFPDLLGKLSHSFFYSLMEFCKISTLTLSILLTVWSFQFLNIFSTSWHWIISGCFLVYYTELLRANEQCFSHPLYLQCLAHSPTESWYLVNFCWIPYV